MQLAVGTTKLARWSYPTILTTGKQPQKLLHVNTDTASFHHKPVVEDHVAVEMAKQRVCTKFKSVDGTTHLIEELRQPLNLLQLLTAYTPATLAKKNGINFFSSGAGGGACGSERYGGDGNGGPGGEGVIIQVLGAVESGDAAPLPVPRKLDPAANGSSNRNPPTLGSVWNQAGTWEEKNLNSWANGRIKASQVTVRNKRVGYNYELSLKFQGEWLIEEENKFRGHLDIPEFSFGEIDDLEIQVRFSDDKGLGSDNKTRLCKDLKSFLSPIQEKLCMFEEELKGR